MGEGGALRHSSVFSRQLCKEAKNFGFIVKMETDGGEIFIEKLEKDR
jgi:hypothetical protein